MNVYIVEVARRLAAAGVEVEIFTRATSSDAPPCVEMAPGVRVRHVISGPFEELAKEELPAQLCAFTNGVMRAEAARPPGYYDLIHSHYWLSGVAGLRLRERWGAPLVHMFHTLARLKNEVAQIPGELEPALRVDEEARIVAEADRIVAANVVERAHLVWYYGARSERIAVIPCGVDTELFQPMDPAKAKDLLELPPDPLLLYVGRLTPIKGLDTLLEAMAAVPEPAYLLVVGGEQDEPDREHGAALRARVSALGLDRRVRFLRAQPQRRLRLFYAAASATVMPSHYESFGMVALEAMACGSPVVASRVGGLTTTVQDGVTGRLVPEGDPPALAVAITSLLGGPEGRRLGQQATRWAAEHRWPCVAEAVCRLYAELRPAARQHFPHAPCRSWL